MLKSTPPRHQLINAFVDCSELLELVQLNASPLDRTPALFTEPRMREPNLVKFAELPYVRCLMRQLSRQRLQPRDSDIDAETFQGSGCAEGHREHEYNQGGGRGRFCFSRPWRCSACSGRIAIAVKVGLTARCNWQHGLSISSNMTASKMRSGFKRILRCAR